MFSPAPRMRLALLTWLVAMAPFRMDAQRLSDRDVTSAYLTTFARFTEWPVGSFPYAETPIVFGVAGDERLRRTIDHDAKDKLFNGRQIRTLKLADPRDASSAHVVFVAESMASRTADILKAVNGLPVLTVGEAEGFAGAGGMIGLLVENDRLRFEVRLDLTERAGLKVSSRVLTLAKTLHGKK